jgi:opacity protein-like surface antigen
MRIACSRSTAALAILVALVLLPSTAAAVGGAVFVKGGAMRLQDDTQIFDSQGHIPVNVNLNGVSYFTIDFGGEIRFRNGWAVGIEYLGYDNRFTTTSSPAPRGKASTAAVMLTAKKYFFDSGVVHPYVGVGPGFAHTTIRNTNLSSSTGELINDINFSVLLHAVLGLELRIDHLSLMLEVRHVNTGDKDFSVEYESTATGVLLGVGFNW